MDVVKDAIIDIVTNINFEDVFLIDAIKRDEYTYNEFFTHCLLFAEKLRNIDRGKNIVVIMENSIELAMLYFAVLFTDRYIIVIDPEKGKNEIDNILKEIESPYIISTDNVSFLERKAHKCPASVKECIIGKVKVRRFDTLFLVTFTSGTSGKSKGVKHSLNNLLMAAIALHNAIKTTPGSRLIHVMPMTYMAGILNSLFYPFIAGASVILVERFSIMAARRFWEYVSDYSVNLFWLSPFMLSMINAMDRGDLGERYCKKHNLEILVGTAALDEKVRKTFNDRYHVSVHASYGLSETLFVSVETGEILQSVSENGVGSFLDGVKWKISSTGEIYVYVPWMFLGYTNENANTYFEGDYYKTGDLAEINRNCLFIIGRVKDLIVKGGLNISPMLIEKIVDMDSRIAQSIVIGVKDNSGHEKVCCTYTTKDNIHDISSMEVEIKKTILERLGKNYLIDYMWQVADFPRNINGKVDKNRLRMMWEEKYCE